MHSHSDKVFRQRWTGGEEGRGEREEEEGKGKEGKSREIREGRKMKREKSHFAFDR